MDGGSLNSQISLSQMSVTDDGFLLSQSGQPMCLSQMPISQLQREAIKNIPMPFPLTQTSEGDYSQSQDEPSNPPEPEDKQSSPVADKVENNKPNPEDDQQDDQEDDQQDDQQDDREDDDDEDNQSDARADIAQNNAPPMPEDNQSTPFTDLPKEMNPLVKLEKTSKASENNIFNKEINDLVCEVHHDVRVFRKRKIHELIE